MVTNLPFEILFTAFYIFLFTAFVLFCRELIAPRFLTHFGPTLGRHFQVIGVYCNETLDMFDDIFPNEKFGLNGRHLQISTLFVS